MSNTQSLKLKITMHNFSKKEKSLGKKKNKNHNALVYLFQITTAFIKIEASIPYTIFKRI